MVQVPSAVNAGRDADAHPAAPAHAGGSTRESRDAVADSAHLIARGRNADVFLLNDTQVMRRLHTGASTYPNIEALRYLNAQGYPAALIIEVDGTDLILERLHGPNLLQALDAREVSLPRGAQILRDLHTSLHALPLPPSLTTAASTAARPQDCMLHLDLHPGSVLLTADGPRVIDWESARAGPAGVDLATTALIFAEVAVDGGEYARAALCMLRHFARCGSENFRPYLTEAAEVRRTFTNIDPVERDLLEEATRVVDQVLERAGR